MQQALPYRTWLPLQPQSPIGRPSSVVENLEEQSKGTGIVKGVIKGVVSENAVLVFGRRGCCMCHVVKRLLLGHGVNPPVYEVDEQDEVSVIDELTTIAGGGGKDATLQLPLVFIGGKLFGGLDRLMAAHISGELIPILKQAGALWL